MGAVEIVDEAIALELTGSLLLEAVQRKPVEAELAGSVWALDHAEVQVQVRGGRLRLLRRSVHRLPERGASAGAANPSLLDLGVVQRSALRIGQDLAPVDALDRHRAG